MKDKYLLWSRQEQGGWINYNSSINTVSFVKSIEAATEFKTLDEAKKIAQIFAVGPYYYLKIQ